MIVRDNPDKQRYELHTDDQLAAFSQYQLRRDVIEFLHTETVEGFEGHGYGSTLVREALDDVRKRGLQVRPFCPFVRAYITKHPEYRDLVPEADREHFGLAGAVQL